MVDRRHRRALPISRSALRHILRRVGLDEDEIRNLAIRNRHLWPGSADKRIVAPEAINEWHLHPDIRGQLGTGTVHHVTASVSSGSIAAGQATVEWTDEEDAPTGRRGFETFHQQLQDGAVDDIPIDLTGTLNFILFGEWASYRHHDTVTFTLLRDGGTVGGSPVVYDLGPVTDRYFSFDDDGWNVQQGDYLRVEVSNDSGEVQTLSSATFVGKIIGTGQGTTGSLLETMTLDSEVHSFSDGSTLVSTTTLANSQPYTVAVLGDYYRTVSTGVRKDSEFDDVEGIDGGPRHETDGTHISLDGTDASHEHVEPPGGIPDSVDADHLYVYQVTGQGNPLRIATNDSPTSDNSGTQTVAIFDGHVTLAQARQVMV